MGSNSYKYDKELFELLKQEYKERLKIQLTLEVMRNSALLSTKRH